MTPAPPAPFVGSPGEEAECRYIRILHEVLIAPRAVLMPRFDTQIIERPGWWQIVTPSITDGCMNEVGCDELPEENCDGIITQTIALYRQLGVQFR